MSTTNTTTLEPNITPNQLMQNNQTKNITVTIPGGVDYSRTAIATTTTASISSAVLGVSGTAAINIRLPSAGDYSAGQYFTVKDESGAANTKNITILRC